MLKMFRSAPPSPDRLGWILGRMADEMPRVLFEKVLDVVGCILDGGQPTWKRAALIAMLVELFARSGVKFPVGLLVRYVTIHAVLTAKVPGARRSEGRVQNEDVDTGWGEDELRGSRVL